MGRAVRAVDDVRHLRALLVLDEGDLVVFFQRQLRAYRVADPEVLVHGH